MRALLVAIAVAAVGCASIKDADRPIRATEVEYHAGSVTTGGVA